MVRRRFSVAASALLAAATLPVFAQSLEQPTLYRVERGSTFQRGCFPPCMCPIMESVPVSGTFRLELVSIGDVFDFYEVKGVRLAVRLTNDNVIPIRGSGTYAVSTLADLQRMELELVVGDEPPTLYRSDDVPGGSGFPRIAVPISIHGGFCFDTLIELRAKPARRLHVDRNTVGWDPDPEANIAAHDVVLGDLRTLLESGGSFDLATWACLADSTNSTSVPFAPVPPPGEAFWFLERAAGDLYEDADEAQVGSPDDGIARSFGACP